MDFRLLGRLEVWDGSRPVPLGGPKQKAVLAALLLRHSEVVSTDVLIDDVWGERASGGTSKTLQVYVWQLRRALEPGRLPGSPPQVLITQSPGYALRIDDDQLDSDRFEHLARSGRAALDGGEPDRALGVLDDALGLWRGAALADFTYEAFAEPAIARLEELRLAATEDRIDAEIALGGHRHAVAELEALVARHPVRERLRRQLILALYQGDRQADALAACRDARTMLGDELGIDPSASLQELERAILNQDPELAPPPPPTAGREHHVALGGTVRLPDGLPSGGSGVLSFMIADIRGYTAFTQAQGDEAAADLASRFARIAREAVEAHGGEVPELRGDEALAVFPSPRQALRAAVDLQMTFADECELRPEIPLRVGIGIDAGEAVPVDGGYRGGPLNLAARLCSQASAGEIIVSQSVFLLARPVPGLAFEELGGVELKGLAEPIPVFRAGADRTTPAPERRRAAQAGDLPAALVFHAPAIGRGREARRLGWAWRCARRRAGGAVLVTGVPGMGKSLILAEGARLASEDGARVTYVDLAMPGQSLASAVADAAEGPDPWYLAVDAVERASIADVDAIERLARRNAGSPILIAMALDPERADADVLRAVHRLVDDGAVIRLGPLELDDMRRIAALYVGGQSERIPADLLQAAGGIPQRVHEAVADWAHAETAQRLDGYAADTAAGRGDLRKAEAGLAGSIVDLQVVRERAQVYGWAGASSATPPYKGLALFDVGDGEWFFGRERLIAEMVSRLAGASVLGVVGPSGSGKSSAVRAGLVATLTSGVLPGTDEWIIALMRPGEHPLRALDRAIWAAAPESVRDRLVREEGLLRGLPAELSGNQRLLLVVDQFEELFTLCTDEAEREAFVEALVDSSSDAAKLTTVLALRADFYGRCASYPDLAALLGANQVLVGAMTPEEYRQAIEQPAARAGTRIEPALADALVSQVLGAAGALPLLSTTLLELWENRSGSTISHQVLETTGGVRGAVARLAEGVYSDLDDGQRHLARGVFLRLAGPGEGLAVVKRRVPLEEFDPDHSPELAELLDLLAQRRLITIDDASVEVVHEALLREWPRYQEWLAEDAQGRVVQVHLATSAREWSERGRDSAELYRGARLSAASEWASRNDAQLNPVEREFLAASRAQHQAQVRRLRVLLAAAVALLLVAAVAAAVAFVQRGSARRSATSADAQRLGAQAVVQPRLDLSLLLARESVNLDNSPATQSELWATLLRSPAATYVFHVPEPFKGVLALSPDGRTLVVGSDEGIVTFYDARTHRELGSITPPGFRIHKSIVPVGALAFSHDGRLLAVGGWDRIAFLDPRTGQPSGLVAHVPGKGVGVVSRMAFSADDRTLAIGYPRYPGTGFYDSWIVGRVDVPARRAIPPAIDLSGRHPDHDDIDKVIYSPTGDVIASDWRAGKLVIFKQPGLRVRHTYTIPGVTSVAASPDGRTLGIAQDDGAVSIMSLPGGQMRLLGRHAPLGGVWSAQFTPDGRELVTTSADHTTIVWDVRSGTQLDVLTGQGDIIKQQAMSSDGRMLYTASEDGTVTAWDIGGAGRKLGRTLPFTAAYPADIYSNPQPTGVAVSPDGRLLALSQNGGLVRLWNLRTLTQVGAPFRGFKELDQSGTSGAEDMAFSPNGRLLAASGGAGSTVVVWDIRTHAVVHRFTPPNPSLAHGDGLEFSPDGKTLANGDGGNAALLWDLSTGSPQKLRLGNARSNRYALSLAYSPDGSRLATVDGLGLATLWDVARSPARRVISFPAEAAAGWATSVAFSPDGKLLATGSQGVITLRDAHTGRAVRTLRIPNGYNAVLAFSPSSSKLALLARDGAEVWNIATATQVGTALPGASPQAVTTGGPGNLRYTPDGQVVVVSPNGLASIWDVDPAAWSAAACGIAGRQLTRAEWERFVTTKPFARVCP